MKVLGKVTSDDIKFEIDLIVNKITNQYKRKVWVACTNNTVNFCKVYLKNKNSLYEDFVPLSMIGVSCSYHMTQLALKDFIKRG